jgi:hypothetical membrane protein
MDRVGPWQTSLCVGAGIIAPLGFLPFLILASHATPGYGHMASTFSDASSQGAPRPEFMIAGLSFVSVCLLLAAFGLGRRLPRGGRVVRAGMALTSFSILMTAVFRDYNRSSWVPRNREGYLHNTFATIAVFSVLATILAISVALRSQDDWAHLSAPGLAVMIVVALAGLAFTWGPDSHDGLAERMLAGAAFSYLAWVSLTALALERGLSLRGALYCPYPEPRTAPLPVTADD